MNKPDDDISKHETKVNNPFKPGEPKAFEMGKMFSDVDHMKKQNVILHSRINTCNEKVDGLDEKIGTNHTEVCNLITGLTQYRIRLATIWKTLCWACGAVAVLGGTFATVLAIFQFFTRT